MWHRCQLTVNSGCLACTQQTHHQLPKAAGDTRQASSPKTIVCQRETTAVNREEDAAEKNKPGALTHCINLMKSGT